MHLAPLTYDYFFKKAFSNLDIAKAFIQDFLGVIITEIIPLFTDHQLTNKAHQIKFDFSRSFGIK